MVREERERNAQVMREINEKLDSALDKIARLETQQSVPVSEKSDNFSSNHI
jgi:hypothetical protein